MDPSTDPKLDSKLDPTEGPDPAKDPLYEVHYVASDLPQKLPTRKAITEAKATHKAGVGSHNKVSDFVPHYTVKSGRFDTMEAWTMVYLKKMTNIAVPTVYAIFTDKETEKTIYVMERIKGHNLEDAWSSLDVHQKDDVAKQLASDFDKIRALPSLGFFGRGLPEEYGNLGKKPLDDFLFRPGLENFGGPFDSVGQLGKALGDSMRANSPRNLEKSKLYDRFIASILPEGPPVFTHGDIHRRNFVLRQEDGKLFIIDWGQSGWFPACWEYSYAVYAAAIAFDTDWPSYLPKFLHEYPSEACLSVILRNIHLTDAF